MFILHDFLEKLKNEFAETRKGQERGIWFVYTIIAIVDAVFRGGDKHSNHGDSVPNMIRHMVIKIKRDYRWNVPDLRWLQSVPMPQRFADG